MATPSHPPTPPAPPPPPHTPPPPPRRYHAQAEQHCCAPRLSTKCIPATYSTGRLLLSRDRYLLAVFNLHRPSLAFPCLRTAPRHRTSPSHYHYRVAWFQFRMNSCHGVRARTCGWTTYPIARQQPLCPALAGLFLALHGCYLALALPVIDSYCALYIDQQRSGTSMPFVVPATLCCNRSAWTLPPRTAPQRAATPYSAPPSQRYDAFV